MAGRGRGRGCCRSLKTEGGGADMGRKGELRLRGMEGEARG